MPLNLSVPDEITDTNGNRIAPDTDLEGNSVYSCDAEGWSWNETTKTLLLSGANICKFTLDKLEFVLYNSSRDGQLAQLV